MSNHSKKTEAGVIRIDKNVLGEIAIQAAKGVRGVYSVGTNVTNILGRFLKTCPRCSGVRIHLSENVLRINIPIMVNYNVNIHSVAGAVQEKIHSALEDMLGITYAEVNVIVRGIGGTVEKEAVYEGS